MKKQELVRNVWRRALCAMACASMAMGVRAEESDGTVLYYDCKDQLLHGSPEACRELDSAVYKLENEGWYVVSETRTIDHTIEVEKEDQVAHIILCDGVTLTVNGTAGRPGIDVMHNGSLHIYGQSGQTGTLVAKGGVNGAGIGCKTNLPERIDEEYTGRLEFHGGRIVAIGGDYGAGIGGSRDSFGNSLVIYGGEVSATGGCWAAGIGAGAYAGHGYAFPLPGPVPVPVPRPIPLPKSPEPGLDGGGLWRDNLQYNCARMAVWPSATVRAKGGRYGAGIGGSYRGGDGCGGFRGVGGGFLVLYGTVWAEGGEGAAGIGGGKGGPDGGCEIRGSTADVSAFGGNGTFGIGAGAGWDGEDLFEYKVFAKGCEVKEGPQPPGATTYIQKSKDYYHGLCHARFTNIQTSDQEPPKPPSVDYWDGEHDGEWSRTEYELIGEGTQVLNPDGWYVVRGNIKMTDHGLRCDGLGVHIILTDGCRLEIEAPDDAPGIELDETASLHIHPEHEDGTGTLIVSGGLNGAGIGGGVHTNGEYLSCGKLTIHGGRITCMGGAYAAGIGGSCNKGGRGGSLARELTIYGGEVTAIGGWAAAGIGGAVFDGGGNNILIDGGSIRAFGGLSRSGWLSGIGSGAGAKSEPKDINTTDPSRKRDFVIREGDDESVSCRIVKNDSYFAAGTNSYVGILVGRTERVAYRDGRGDMCEVQAEMLIPGESPVNSGDTTSERWFVAEDGISFAQTLTLPGKTANLILPDDSSLSFAAGSSSSPALKAKALNVFGQELGTGMMKVQGGSSASGISTEGDFALHSCLVDVTGARDGVSGGSLTINGGYLRVGCQTALAASSAVTMNGGTVVVTNGETHVQASSLTVSGGNLFVERNKLKGGAAQPKDTARNPLYRLTVVLPDWFGPIYGETVVRITDWVGSASYGLDGLCPIDGRVYLWLPDGNYKFNVDCGGLKIPYEAIISGSDVVANPGETAFDLTVNGERVQLKKTGDGWNYRDGVLHLTGENGTFVISGSSTKGEVQVLVEKNMTVVLSKARVCTSGRSAMMLAPNVSVNLRMQDGESFLSASGRWIRRRGDVTGAGIEVSPTATLTITGDDSSVLWLNGGYGSAGIGGTSRNGIETRHCGSIDIKGGNVIAIGGENGAGIGGGREGMLFGDIVLGRDANVTATGGWGAAGIGGGLGSLANTARDGVLAQGQIRLAGAVVSACGGYGAAGIGGGRYITWKIRRKKKIIPRSRKGDAPQVSVEDGTIFVAGGETKDKGGDGTDDDPAPNWNACADIGVGENASRRNGGVLISGGTIVAARGMIDPRPTDRNRKTPVFRVSVVDADLVDGQPVSLAMNENLGYGTNNIYSADGKIHLYLPDYSTDFFEDPTTHYFLVNDIPYVAVLDGSDTVATRGKKAWDCELHIANSAPHVTGFVVSNNFEEIGVKGVREDWLDYVVKSFDDVTVNFTVEEGYVRPGGTRICIPGIVDNVTLDESKFKVHPFDYDNEKSYGLVSHGMEWIDLGYRSVASTRVECFAWPEISVGPETDWSHFLSGLATTLITLKIYEGETLVRDLVPFMTSDGSVIFGLYDRVTRKPFVNRGEGSFALDNVGGIPYRAWNAEKRQMEDRLCIDATQFMATNTTVLTSGWYVVSGTVKINNGGIDIVGSVHLILCDGANMFLDSAAIDRPGIRVEEGASLSIYGQDQDSGKLTVRSGDDAAAIGGDFRKTCGIVDIHGGDITAVQFDRCIRGMGSAGIGGGAGGNYGERGGGGGDIRIHGGKVTVEDWHGGQTGGAGIGGGSYGDGGTVVIDGGTVTVQGGTLGAGIGGGRSGSGGNVTINGGTVEARGGSGMNGHGGAAGIGSGGETGMHPPPSSGGVTTINGGFVKAIGGIEAFGIGAGASNGGRKEMGVITINGGTVVTTKWDVDDLSIGGDTTNSRLTIDGGSIKARTAAGLAKNSTPTNVYCVTVECTDSEGGVSLEGLVGVEGLEGYGTKDVYALWDDEEEASFVYLWLPDGTHRFMLSDGTATFHYCVVVKGRDVQIEPLPPVRDVGFFVNGRDIGETPGEDDGWRYQDKVLTLEGAKTYVLSGAATNDEVQVKVARQGATVVLSIAVVFAEGREALDVAQSAALQMAGGASFLGTTKDFAAVKVAEGMALTVDLAPGADRNESMVGVFNSGNAKAIAGKGSVKANGGTFFVWADGQAVETPSGFTVGAGAVMKTGDTPEKMRFATVCGNAPCVLVAPGVTVTVLNIPHVTGHTVSNAVEEIQGADFPAGKVYRVMAGDDVFVGYALEEGYVSKSSNPLVYGNVEGDITIDAGSIEIWPSIPYRAWNEETRQMEDRVCTSYEVVTAGTQAFEDGVWYVVRDPVTTTNLTINGAAHLILCDGKTLTASGHNDEPGVKVRRESALHIYGQVGGTGALVANGGKFGAGIGICYHDIFGADVGCGAVTIDGGTVTANGGEEAAGIGGGRDGSGGTVTINGGTVMAMAGATGAGIGGGMHGAGGLVTINGGTVTATGGIFGAGIGGGDRGFGGMVTINGGTVMATGGYRGSGIGGGTDGAGGTVTINGGSVKAETIRNAPKNASGYPLCRVTVKCPGVEGLVGLEGLGDYGTNDIYAVDNRVYLWLPNGTHYFTLSDGTTTYRYCAVVKGRDITVEPLAPVGFFVNGEDVGGGFTPEDGWRYQEKVLTLEGAKTYVLSGSATNNEVQVKVMQQGATVVLSNAVVFTEGRTALDVTQSAALQMAGGASFLGTAKNYPAVAVASNAKLAVDLTPDADRNESMIGVFNSGNAAAIAGAGSVVVKGGTFFVWSDNTAVGLPEFTCDPDEIMQAGDTPEEMWYTTTDWRSKPCVLVGPAVTVTVLKNTPHVSGFTVSNDVQAIQGFPVPPGATYRVMLGDDLFVGYTVEEGYTSQAANPLVYVDVEKDFTVDAQTIPVLPHIPYRAWNETTRQMEDRVCTNYTVVTNVMTAFENGQWYAVTGAVSTSNLTVNGSAHLILRDGAKLTATGFGKQDEVDHNHAGIEISAGNALTIYGQKLGTGELEATATGGHNSAGIGASEGQTGGVVTINGGIVTATGSNNGAGIGSGYAQPGSDDSSNRITINGGRIKATGDGPGAGLGGGYQQHGGTLVINGGTVDAIAGWNNGASLGNHVGLPDPLMRVEVNGGSIKADSSRINIQPVNAANAAVWCVTVNVERLNVEGLKVEGLEGYGTNDIYAVDNRVYLWLPNGTHRFTISDGATTHRYCAVVDGKGVTVEPLGPIGFFVDDIDIGEFGAGDGWHYQEKVLTLDGAKACVLSGAASNNEVQVHAAASGATAVLSNAVVFASERPAVVVAQGATLKVAANQVMKTGRSPEAMTYSTSCGDAPCVLAAPGVTVTVKNGIPHVTDITVSNEVQAIQGTAVEGGMAYRVMAGDDIFVGYTVEEGYTSRAANPLVYAAVESDVTVDAQTIPVLRNIPYRAWNGTTRQMEDKVCTDYTVVTAETRDFDDGKWYVVTGEVSRGSIVVYGSAHLILCDGAKLTAKSTGSTAGIRVGNQVSLSVYGQSEGTGELEATGGDNAAGIGNGESGSYRDHGGSVTINGGKVTATGGWCGAGIGGGDDNSFGTVTINGGVVVANGSECAAGIGGGDAGHGYSALANAIVVNGGTVLASSKECGLSAIFQTIDGGSVQAKIRYNNVKNSTPTNVYCVTVKCEGLKVERLKVEGLEGYGTNDIYPINNRVCLWLPDGTHHFAFSDGTTTYRYCAVVKGRGITVEPLGPVGFFVNGEDVGDDGVGDGWYYQDRVLTLDSPLTYVLSGEATNNEVQVKTDAYGAKVVLSNAVVFTSGRPALVVDARPSVLALNAALQMAGGTSYLAATNGSAAISVAPAVTLTVDLAQGADRKEAMIGVFNYGPAKAIAGTGRVKVNGGTFFVWADEQAVETPDEFACGAKEAMMTGEMPETLRYVEDCDGKACVLVGPGVTVTVKNGIPHVTDITVSNDVQTIQGTAVEGGMAYRVMAGDDIFVGYTVEKGYVSKSPNPLVYLEVEGDKTVDAGSIETRLSIPYRAWNETTRQMEDMVCTDYTVVTAETVVFEDDKWYVVDGQVATTDLAVNGAAHLILCDGATLTANGRNNNAGVRVVKGRSLAVYGQALGTGALVAQGGSYGAGIGGGSHFALGAITVNGGAVTARGGTYGAGIGGGDRGAGGTVTVNGGRVTAMGGGGDSAGVGGGYSGSGGTLTINGGTVEATGSGHGRDIGACWGSVDGSLTIDGGSVKAKSPEGLAKNSALTNVYCVTVKCEGIRDQGSGIRLAVEGLGNYGTNDIYAVDGRVYLWLPDGAHHFTISDGETTCRYCAVVKGRDITVEPLAPVGFFVNGEDIGDTGSGTGWDYSKDMKSLTLSAVGLYVLSGAATNDEVKVKVATGGATVVLSNAVVFTSGRPALDVAQSAALQMAGGASYLGTTNNAMSLSVGPNAVLTVGLAPGANEAEAMIGVFNYGDPAAIAGAGEVKVVGGTLAVWADKRASEVPLTRAADVFCMVAGSDPETAKVVDTYDGEAYVLMTASVAPVMLDKPVGPFDTPEAASNAMAKAVFMPSAAVESKLGAGSSALGTYCNMFGFAVTGGGEAWSVEAALLPEARSNVVQSAQEASWQIPLADIVALPLNTSTNVTAKGCGVPGFYYSFYSGSTVTNLGAVAAEKGRNVLCGTDRDVEFSGVVKPSDAAGFFTVGVRETPDVHPSDRAELEPPARMGSSE